MNNPLDSSSPNLRLGRNPASRLIAEELELTQSVSASGLAANLVIAILVVAGLWGKAGVIHLLAWFAYMACAVGVRFVLFRAYQRGQTSLRNSPHWGKIITGGNLLIGLGWAWMGVVLVPEGDLALQLAAIGAIAAAAATAQTISPSRESLTAFLVPALLPLIVSIGMTAGGALWLTAAMLVVLLGILWITLNQYRNRLLESIAANQQRRESDAAMLRGAETANRLFAQVVTERERAEAELKIAKQAADDANRAKGDFLAYTSHEIRTPLNAIIGFADVIQDSPLNATQQDYVRRIKGAGNRLLTLINDLLDLSKIEAGKLNIEFADFPLRQTLDEVTQEQAVRARDKKIGLEMHVGDNVPDNLIGDSLRLRQILINLIGNAIKFTAQGKVVTRVQMKSLEGGVAHLVFSVSDTGIGISPEKQAALFQRYVQADVSTSRRYGGTGLGLSICKSLVELMGGSIGVRSEDGKGSTFSFELPCRVQEQVMEKKPEEAVSPAGALAGAGLNLLVAEDNEHNQLLIELLLKRQGAQVTMVGNGAEALNAMNAGAFDLVLMDLEMPVMGGFEAVAELRRREGGNGKHVPVIALSAHAADEQRDNCIAAGMDDFLTKPIDLKALQALLRRYASVKP
jgi:signal transduction histidine kinase/CheY-like chemotaxis protein